VNLSLSLFNFFNFFMYFKYFKYFKSQLLMKLKYLNEMKCVKGIKQ